MEDDVWAAAQESARRQERKPGMTPLRRATLRIMRPAMVSAIEAAIKDKTRLPHGRLGQLLQVVEPHTLATIALEAITPQIGRTAPAQVQACPWREARCRRDLLRQRHLGPSCRGARAATRQRLNTYSGASSYYRAGSRSDVTKACVAGSGAFVMNVK